MNEFPKHDALDVLDRKADSLPSEECTIEIFNDGEWLRCLWNPRTPESIADDGYLGTARTTDLRIQIGFHAWKNNDHEFRYFCFADDNFPGPSSDGSMAATTKSVSQLGG